MLIVFNIPLLVLWIWEFGLLGCKASDYLKTLCGCPSASFYLTKRSCVIHCLDYSVKLDIWCYTYATVYSSWRDIFECLISLDPFSPEVAAGIRVESNGEADACHHDWLIDRSQRNVGSSLLGGMVFSFGHLGMSRTVLAKTQVPNDGPNLLWGPTLEEMDEFRVTSGDATPKRYFPKNGINLRWMKQGYMI